ncbi:MAG: hypothetical protein KAS13_00650 [Candidatus Omnitrophica bacterium]|nr:hypothetical protein [Candidatus Omnitrophota bacterium]
MISFQDFKKMELKIATVKDVQDHPDADRLYVLKVKIAEGQMKQIVAGIKKHYSKEYLLEKQVVIVNNLEPAMLRGVESQGMLLAASDENDLAVIVPEKKLINGSSVR